MTVRPWPLIADESVLQTPVFDVRSRLYRSPLDGQAKRFTVLHARQWVQVLALTEAREVLLVRQFRFGAREISLELPGGVLEPGQSPLETAQRELREETGYAADQWRELAAFRPNPALQDNTAHLFLAEGAHLAGPTDFDENEDLDLVAVPLGDLKALVLNGAIDHAIMVAAILFYFAREECKE